MVLIRAILTGLVVYWFALARCPKSILNTLHKLIYNFLWGSSVGHSLSHLVNWETLALPIEFGGWDIKNLEWFGISLRLKSLWLLLTVTGIWSRIIAHKYLKNRPLDDWIRGQSFSIVGTSYFWNGFIRIIGWITCQLGWKVGNGLKIRVGIDPIAGQSS